MAYSTKEIREVAPEAAPPLFGEYLVERAAIDRHQLLVALQLQDREPGARLGECIAALGFLSRAQVEAYLSAFDQRM